MERVLFALDPKKKPPGRHHNQANVSPDIRDVLGVLADLDPLSGTRKP